ncbi:unnamed protein product [Clavelina lepadiformis]|uniref:Uncharacterized protein n=1 Tax=Clavelina lepadiformis TaxID=159417 RepID=A0ABP0H691_CLALP
MYRLKPMQHSLDPANGHLDNMIFEQINYNDGDEESPGLVQPTSNARMTDEQSTPVKTLCRTREHTKILYHKLFAETAYTKCEMKTLPSFPHFAFLRKKPQLAYASCDK